MSTTPNEMAPAATNNGGHNSNNFDSKIIVVSEDNIKSFSDAIRAAGLTPPVKIVPSNKFQRFPGYEKNGKNRAGWCKLFPHGRAGVFGDFSNGLSEKWLASSNGVDKLTEADRIQLRKECDAAAAAAELEMDRAKARERAESIWSGARPCLQHDYLTRKGVKSHGLKLYEGNLVIPIYDAYDRLNSLQYIAEDGSKRFLKSGQIKGCYFSIGNSAGILCICEGYATAASIHEATGYAVAAAFSAGNLLPVAKALRNKYPDSKLIICADADENHLGESKARKAAKAVGGIVVLPTFGPNQSVLMTDFNDLQKQDGLEAVRSQIEAGMVTPVEGNDDENGEGKERDTNQASKLVAYVEKRCELFHDKDKEVYAKDRDTCEVRKVDSRQFRDWLVATFYKEHSKTPRDQAVREAISTINGLGRYQGECCPVYIRIAQKEGAYYLDLAESGKSRAIRIESGRWEIIDKPPVMFFRPESMQPLPEPVRGGDINSLWEFANIPASKRYLVITWMLQCLRPETPFAILELFGEQGTAKSTTQIVLRRLIDPNASDLRAAPKSVEDIFVAAKSSWLISYENISHLNAQMQDSLCVIATGGGYAKRKLYSDAEESIIIVKRPVVINGISIAVTAQDLTDRTVSIELPIITDRQEGSVLLSRFDQYQANLLGALLDVFAKSLALLPTIKLSPDDRPRMVEFAKLGCAVSEAMGQSHADFMEQFNDSRSEAIARTIDASPVASAVITWFESRSRIGDKKSLKDWLEELEQLKPPGTDAWPRSAKGLGDALRRIAPALRHMGIECKSHGKQGSNVIWEIKQRAKVIEPCRESLKVVDAAASQHDMTTSTTSYPHVTNIREVL